MSLRSRRTTQKVDCKGELARCQQPLKDGGKVGRSGEREERDRRRLVEHRRTSLLFLFMFSSQQEGIIPILTWMFDRRKTARKERVKLRRGEGRN